MKRDNTIEAFFALIRAGLWEMDINLSDYEDVDFQKLYNLAEEQAVIGIIAAGLDHVQDSKIPKEIALQFVGQALQLEQQNTAMNEFIGAMVEKLRNEDICTLLLKGQGIAQCYARPLWRSCGDVDFFLSEDNYKKAKNYLLPFATSVEPEGNYNMHLGLTIDSWVVELHGNLRSGLSCRIDSGLDKIKDDIIFGGNVRSWSNGSTQVFLPSADNDSIYIFTHILQHFYRGGIGVRQVCDWCRLLWTYREKLNLKLLETRIRKAGLMSEWKAFGAFAVEYVGVPIEAMPLYSDDRKWKRKAKRICDFILTVGNFGHNRDRRYYEKYPYIIRKAISMGRRCGDLFRHARIFPIDSMRFFPRIVINGIRSAANGE